jgi:hypothetical protein
MPSGSAGSAKVRRQIEHTQAGKIALARRTSRVVSIMLPSFKTKIGLTAIVLHVRSV